MRRVMAVLLVAAAAAACGEGGTTDAPATVERLVAADSVVITAVRDTATLSADLVLSDASRTPATGVTWGGCNSDVAVVDVQGRITTVGAGTCEAFGVWGEYQATVRIVVRREGVLTLTFDDGWKSARSVALPILADAGLVGNVAVVPGTVGWPAYLSVEEMASLNAAGWAFVSHGMTHADLTTLSPEEVVAEITGPVRWLRERGLRAGNVLVVPYHEWGEREKELIRAEFAAARGRTVDWYWPEFMADWRPSDPYAITTIDASALARTEAGRDSAMAYVEQAVSEGRLLDLMFHDIGPADEAGFRALIQRVARYGDRVRTWSEIYPLSEGPG